MPHGNVASYYNMYPIPQWVDTDIPSMRPDYINRLDLLPDEIVDMIMDINTRNQGATRIQAQWRGFQRGFRRFFRDCYYDDLRWYGLKPTTSNAIRLALRDHGPGGFSRR